jgi:hypothetical protein
MDPNNAGETGVCYNLCGGSIDNINGDCGCSGVRTPDHDIWLTWGIGKLLCIRLKPMQLFQGYQVSQARVEYMNIMTSFESRLCQIRAQIKEILPSKPDSTTGRKNPNHTNSQGAAWVHGPCVSGICRVRNLKRIISPCPRPPVQPSLIYSHHSCPCPSKMHLFTLALWIVMTVTCQSDNLISCVGATSQNVGFCADANTASQYCTSASSFQIETDNLGICGVFSPSAFPLPVGANHSQGQLGIPVAFLRIHRKLMWRMP